MRWIYLSPHLDDVALSCGGLVWEQAQSGETVEVWTICAGDPPPGPLSPIAQELHTRWKAERDAPRLRRVEDEVACVEIGARPHYFSFADCIYRRDATGQYVIGAMNAIADPQTTPEPALVNALGAELVDLFPQEAQVVCPLALGGHVDHRLTRAAAELAGKRLLYYQDYPYVLQPEAAQESQELAAGRWRQFTITAGGLKAWQRAIFAYTSQLSTFWTKADEMEAAIADYCHRQAGARLWQPL